VPGHRRRGFALDSTNRDAVVQVCRRLDGIPLAIELAEARAGVMSVEQIAARLDERFRLLTRGGRTAVPRQQTLQGAIDWSYELLAAAERELFDVLGVFAGDFDLGAAAAVAGLDEFEVLDLVAQLVGKSMVEADPSRDRYRLLETLRQYAWDRLIATGRLGDTRDAHAGYYATLAGAQAALMRVAGRQVGALDRLEADYDNLRAALAHLIEEHQADAAVHMVRRLGALFNIRHPREGLGWFRQVIAIADDLPAKARARLLGDTAWAAMNAGDLQAHYAQAAIEAGGSDAPAVAYWLLAQEREFNSDFPLTVEHARQAVTLAAAAGEVAVQVSATGQLVLALAALGEEAEARRHIPELIELAEGLGNPTMTATAGSNAASALALLSRHDEAVALFEQALAHVDAGGPIQACTTRTNYALEVDDPHEAASLLRVAIPIAKDQLGGSHQLWCLVAAAKLMAQTGRPELAAQFLGAYRRHWEQAGSRGTLFMSRWHDRLLDQLTDTIGPAALDIELGRGARLTVDHALQLALDAIEQTKRPGG